MQVAQPKIIRRMPAIQKRSWGRWSPCMCGSIRSACSTGAWSSRSRFFRSPGYYIHDPFIVGQVNHPFLMGWFRFVHEVVRDDLHRAVHPAHLPVFRRQPLGGLAAVRSAACGAVQRDVGSDRSSTRSSGRRRSRRSGTTPWRRFPTWASIRWWWSRSSPDWSCSTGCATARSSVRWSDGSRDSSAFPNLRLIHFLLMFVFIAFGVFHVHLCMLISREEKRGLMDSIFIGYKVIPADELAEEEKKAALEPR